MTKITSRPKEHDQNVTRLKEILEVASLGAISTSQQSLIDPEETMEGLLTQTGMLFSSLLKGAERFGLENLDLHAEVNRLSLDLDIAQDALSNLIGNIDYDEALDHAAADLMDCMCSSGAADVTSNGELEFDERVTFTKEDIKPWLREAIVRWVELKMGQ